MYVFTESSFFKKHQVGDLPTPAEVRATNVASGHLRASYFESPPPVRIASLGLLVKYGADVKVTEALTQNMVREQVGSRVPVPEVFGWTEDGRQGFIYMELIEGDTLHERWGDMDEAERLAVCAELKTMAEAWRGIPQDIKDSPYIGSFGDQPLNDIFLRDRPELTGPFKGVNAVQDFHQVCDIEIKQGTPVTAIVFTHDDLLAPNILLSRGPNPKVAAIIDWEQSGWYPAYWEFCKARRLNLNPKLFRTTLQEEWREKYLPLILDPVDDESCYHPWLWFVLSKGI